MLWIIIGACAAMLTTFSFIPQIVKVVRTKSAKDVSLLTLVQLSAGVSLWIIYGVYRRDMIIILANTVTLLSLVILISLFFRWEETAKKDIP